MSESDKKNTGKISNEELLTFLKQTFADKKQPIENQPSNIEQPPVQIPKTQPAASSKDQEKQMIAKIVMKLHKEIMILCLMLFIMPMVVVLISIISGTIAICIAMFTIIYPAYLYMKSNKYQEYLSRKYNLKPFVLIKTPMQQTNTKTEETIF